MLLDYFVSNFPLLCVLVVMVIIGIQNFRTRKKLSVCFLAILTMTFVLSLCVTLETFFKQYPDLVFWATSATAMGYIIRPFCIYMLIVLAEKNMTNRKYWLYLIPALVNALAYIPSMILPVEFFRTLAFYYEVGSKGTLEFCRGPLNYTAHVICAIYLVFLILRSIQGLRGKHRADSYPILICSAFIVAAVVLEMTSSILGVLNNTIAISCVFFYLFLLDQANRRDALTGLFDRKTYYADIEKFGSAVHGVIQLDMNGLKAINDTQGHEAGDFALAALGNIFKESAGKNQYVYRVGGDEFTILQSGGNAKDIDNTAETIKKRLEGSELHCSVGAVFDLHKKCEDLIKEAETKMYEDKAAFYANNPQFERRSVHG